MTSSSSCRGVLVLLAYAAVFMAFPSEADERPTERCPPPTNLLQEWLDDFTLNLSWKEPRGLPNGNKIEFTIMCANYNGTCMKPHFPIKTTEKYLIDTLLTEEHPDHWMCKNWTVSSLCNGSTESTPATIIIAPRKPRAALVKDFKCLIMPSHNLKCSWIPANPSQDLTFSYRPCGRFEERVKGLKTCHKPYSSGERSGCNLPNDTQGEICVLMDADAGMSTFKARLELPPPNVSIAEDGDHLRLSWAPPTYGNSECWKYEICFTQCHEPMNCPHTGVAHFRTPYDKSCHYEFRIRVVADKTCLNISSVFTEPVSYGSDKPPDGTLTVVAIVIPIILSICVVLSCYCFRRYKLIFCPILPDPSAIFKDLMMNGNKELETTTRNLYMPVLEPIESCKIIIVPETSVQTQNS